VRAVPEPHQRVGAWLIGARGNVATLSIVGALAIRAGVTSTTGMVTERAPVDRLDLPPVDELVFGGHDVREIPLGEAAAEQRRQNGVPDGETLDAVADDLAAVDDRIRVGTARNCGAAVTDDMDGEMSAPTVSQTVDQIRGDYAQFREANGLDRVVVINLASTEPPVCNPGDYDTREAFERAVADDDQRLPASSLYAYAALEGGHPIVNFTPSAASALGGLRELAVDENVPHYGRDAKTGETLVKSALAPMFAGRNLRVLAWEGHNVLGNEDGRVLEDDANKAGKLQSKGGVLEALLPDIQHNEVRIDYVPSLADWKTAWDFVQFEGFLDTEMTMQFTWQGSDSALAAPLVLDLVRLAAHADEHDEGGLQSHLASFFKDPIDVDEHDLSRQFDMLYEYVDRHVDSEQSTTGGLAED
jgi:myo-inositol-1-phosphate synthase